MAGMLAGVMMAMVEMLYGWASDAHTFWDAPMAIWAWVAGIEHFGQPENHVWPIILGMGGHMMNSMMIGVMFALLITMLRSRDLITSVMLGVAYGLGIWALMRYVLLPLNEREDDLFTTDLVSPQWVWWVAHAALGMTAGAFYDAVAVRVRPLARKRRPRARAGIRCRLPPSAATTLEWTVYWFMQGARHRFDRQSPL